MIIDSNDDDTRGARVSDLTRDGFLAPILDAVVRPVEAERDAYREIAIEKEVALLDAARRDVDTEATRRSQRRRLKSV